MLDGIHWILFDAVGTLISPDPPVAEVYHSAARRFGSGLSIDEISEQFAVALAANFAINSATSEANERRRWRSIVAQVIQDIPHSIDSVFEQLWHHFAQPEHWRLYDDVATSLADLHRRDYHLGIASNFDGRLKNIVNGHSPLAICDELFVSSEVGHSKPDPRFFRAIETELSCRPDQILLVGDDEVCDVQAATAAGWRAIRIHRGSSSRDTIRSLVELIPS
jgi:putative hydrolase of the HAD superfamily